jgi:hypothetical protein
MNMASPSFEYEWEGLPELEWELSPIRRVYPDALDAMMEHLAHVAAEAESEQEAAEGFLPLIPLVASKLLPLAAKAIPAVAKALPKISNVVSRVTPQLTRGVSNITRGLFRNPRTRPLVRAVPSIARRTVTSIARQAAAGRPVTPQVAQRTLTQQTRSVLADPRQAVQVLRRSRRLDLQAHRLAGVRAAGSACPTCGQPVTPPPSCCGGCQQVTARCGTGCGEPESESSWWPDWLPSLPNFGLGCALQTDPDTGLRTCTKLAGCSGRCELGMFGCNCVTK